MSCHYIFAKSEETFFVKSSGSKLNFQSRLFTKMNVENFETLFTHNYHGIQRRNIFGAKAIVILLPNHPADVYFFATGVGENSWNVHHLRAAETILNLKYGFHIVADHGFDHWPYVQGYEFTALKDQNGRLRITKIDIESQITRLRKMLMTESVDLNFELTALQALLSRMDSALMADDFSISMPWLNK